MSDKTTRATRATQALATALTYAGQDLRHAHSAGARIVYNLDFGLLSPQLFDSRRHPRAVRHSDTAPRIRRVLSAAPTDPRLAITVSVPTILEFEDQLAHVVRTIQYSVRDSVSRLDRGDDHFLRDAVTTSSGVKAQLVRDLELVTEAGQDSLATPVSRFIQLVEDGALIGIDDVVDLSGKSSRARTNDFHHLVEQHRAQRLKTDAGRRSEAESDFHYKIDVANVLITKESVRAGDVPPVLFVTQTYLNVRQCRVGQDQYARSELVPLIIANANKMISDGLIKSERAAAKHLRMLGTEGVLIVEEMKEIESVDDLEISAVIEQARCNDQTSLLVETSPARRAETPSDDERRFEELRELIADPQKLASAIEQSVETVRREAKRIHAMYERSYASYMDTWDLKDDPIFRKVRRDLGLTE